MVERLEQLLEPYLDVPAWIPLGPLMTPLLEVDAGTGTLVINRIRAKTGGDLPRPERTSDALLDAVLDLAVEAYGELLLLRALSPDTLAAAGTRAGERARQAAGTAPGWPFQEKPVLTLTKSTGSIERFPAELLPPSVVVSAWQHARLAVPDPTLDALLASVRIQFARAEAAVTGHRTTSVTAVVSLGGVRLPPGTTIALSGDAAGGQVRCARPDDHSLMVYESRRRFLGPQPGSAAEADDAGTLLLDVPVTLNVSFKRPPPDQSPAQTSTQELNATVNRVRVALLLAFPKRLLDITTIWQQFLDPVTHSAGIFAYPPQHRTPDDIVELAADDVDEWSRWLRLLRKEGAGNLTVAFSRLLRAVSERRDPHDALVDTVICWEALFGGQHEATFRVSTAIARLLESDVGKRGELQREVRGLYTVRSHLVHGRRTDGDVPAGARRAQEITVEVLRELYGHRPELLPLASDERATTLLLG